MTATKDVALISQAKVGIAFEYGGDGSLRFIQKTVLGIKKLLAHLKVISGPTYQLTTPMRYFDVFSTAPKPSQYRLLKHIKNYQLVKKGDAYATNSKKNLRATEDFYPILFGEKNIKIYLGLKVSPCRLIMLNNNIY